MALNAPAWLLANAFTKDTANEFGAVKGAPCTVGDVTFDADGNTVVELVWTNSAGQTRTTSATIKKGEKGDKGDTGEQGPKGDSGASDWNEINNKPFDSVDTELSTTSTNPVQNKVITTNLSNITRRTRRNITSDLANLTTAIAEQNLAKYGYAIGDYFVGASGYYYHLADMDTNYGGYNNQAVVNTHHCGIVVDTKSTCQWLSEGTVTNYSSSTLHSFLTNTALPKIKSDIATLFGDWESHLLKRTEVDNAIGGWGTIWNGLKNCLICAMTEVQVYGTRVFGVDGYQTGTGSKALELFRKYRFNEIYGDTAVWLKSIVSDSSACSSGNGGDVGSISVSYSRRASGLILFH